MVLEAFLKDVGGRPWAAIGTELVSVRRMTRFKDSHDLLYILPNLHCISEAVVLDNSLMATKDQPSHARLA